MDESGACLGLCFEDHQLYYAVSEAGQDNHLHHIGCIDFSFPLEEAIALSSEGFNAGIQSTLSNLSKKYNCRTVRVLSPAQDECWSTCPRLVYETPDERDDHLAILMDNSPRNQLETTWFDLSNQDYKLLLIRNKNRIDNYRKLLAAFSECDFVTEFEIGSEWHNLTGMRGAYLTINCHTGYIAVSSYLLGKLRGATYIEIENIDDLPYLWNFYGSHLTWMNGIHEQVYIYGNRALDVSDVMASFFIDTVEPQIMNSLDSMRVHADEQTYGFSLESAFPAVLLSLNSAPNQP